jgi:hypothetical protein
LDLFDVVRSCARRWYVFLPLLLIVGWFSYSTYSDVKPVYYSSVVIGLSPPSSRVDTAPPGVPIPRNGLLDVGGASLIANMAAMGLRDPSVVDQVAAAGGLPDYEAKMFPGPATMPQLPLIMVDVTNADRAAVTQTLELVTQQAALTVRNLQKQAQVPEDQMVAPFVVAPPSTPAAGMPARTRSTIAIFVAGAGLSVLLTVVFDVFMTRFKARRRQRLASAEAGAKPEPADAPRDGHQIDSGATVTPAALEPT